MTIKEFLDIEMPTNKNFIKLDKPEYYDFSNDKNKSGIGASKAYRNLSIDEDNEKILEKFFAYMSESKKATFVSEDKNVISEKKFNGNEEYNTFYEKASKKVIDNLEKYGSIIDPDSNSQLLQSIYEKLWNKKVLEHAKDINGNIKGDTLNSANTTLNELYKCMENMDEFKEEKSQRENMKISKYRKRNQFVSISFILSKYLTRDSGNSKIIDNISKDSKVSDFLKSYHTLGNFMPIPAGSNPYRAKGIAKDYLDITLLFIYNYYINGTSKDEGIKKLINPMQKEYIKWLNVFGSGQEGWDNFVQKNYFGDEGDKINFVPKKEDGHYGCPRELWSNHFVQVIGVLLGKGNVLPNDKEQCIEYFVNAKNWTYTRGELMVKALKEKM